MLRFLSALLLSVLTSVSTAAAEPLWSQLFPPRQAEVRPATGYQLQPEHGPWLVVAATFSGEGAQDQARDLAVELRKDYNLRAYVHRVSFDLTDEAPVRGLDAYGRPRRAKFRRGDEVTEIAVLVGDFPAVDDVEAQRVLKRIKHLRPKTLTGEVRDSTSQNLAAWRTLKNAVLRRKGEAEDLGPMSAAFISRNPLLPAEYFVPKGVDRYVEDMNRGVEYSLLDAPHKYTVKVATFRGRSSLVGASSRNKDTPLSGSGENPLHVAAAKAHKLTLALREKGWEAYEFHDYQESIVTVGSFEEVAQRTLDGEEAPVRDVAIILRTFGAAYEPVVTDSRAQAVQQKAEELKQRFRQVFSQRGQIASGFHPKSLIGIPFDIYPAVMEAPKRSISTAYVRGVQ